MEKVWGKRMGGKKIEMTVLQKKKVEHLRHMQTECDCSVREGKVKWELS